MKRLFPAIFFLLVMAALTITLTVYIRPAGAQEGPSDSGPASTEPGPGGEERPQGGPPPGPRTPPPEAYKACEGKTAGDTARMTSPRGDAVSGTCVQMEGRLVLLPDFMKNRGERQGRQGQ